MNQEEIVIEEKEISVKPKNFPIKVLLVDDQLIVAEAIKMMLSDCTDIVVIYCNNPLNAIEMAINEKPTVILQDLVMPELDGLVLVKYFRANPQTLNIPLIVLSTREDPKLKAAAFGLGANDYLVKLPDKIELEARIRYHSQSFIRLLERNEAYQKLQASQKLLQAELSEAASYVTSLLPRPWTEGPILTEWVFVPSARLGGDIFGYHWIDENHFSIFLIDVCGHGVGAAMLSVTMLNTIRSKNLPNTDFSDPVNVLFSLNKAFPMENHNEMFSTVWYGVYDRRTRELEYSSAGHPPALLISGNNQKDAKLYELGTPGFVLGGLSEVKFHSGKCTVGSYNKFILFSDGVYEVRKLDDTMYTIDELIRYVEKEEKYNTFSLVNLIHYIREVSGSKTFSDDFSIVQVYFK